MKNILMASVLVVILVGCAGPQIKPHRVEFYQVGQKEKTAIAASRAGDVVLGGGLGFFGAAAEIHRREQKAQAVYPECQGLVETVLWECVRQIDIKEGRITADYVEPKRPNMDAAIMGRQ